MKQELTKIDGVTVLDNEAGTRFYHKHKSLKARRRKKHLRKMARKNKQRSR